MWSRTVRLGILALFAVGVVAGVAMEAALDPVEQVDPGYALIGLVVGGLAIAGVTGYWFNRKLVEIRGPDERIEKIELRASRRSQGVLLAGVVVLAALQLLSWIELPYGTLLWGLVVAGIATHELSIEYYRRRM